MRLRLLTLIGLAFALPAPAAAADATIVKRDVPLAGQRALQVAKPPARFELVGLHWRGPGSVQFRTRSLAGRWSAWQDAAPEEEDRPDAHTDEHGRAGGWRLGNPWWVGPSNGIEYRLRGPVKRLRAWFVRSEPSGVPARTLQAAGRPAIVPRSGWRADESIRRGTPSYAPALRVAVVHHTAGANGYTAAQSPAIVKAIQAYHVKGNGWNDIGYNFLVDRFGTVFEGRYGGIEENVVGAHAEGFNTGSVGVALLGQYGSLAVAPAARDALARLLAWRLDLAHVDPASTLSYISGGNARFPSGIPVFLRTVSGHRDTGFTDCPGNALYNLLTGLAADARGIGLPKLYAPTVTGKVPGTVRFRARLSSAQPWNVDVYDATGGTLAAGSGAGQNVDWTWDASSFPPGAYTYAIRSADGAATPVTGTVGGGEVALAIGSLAADPETISPNFDELADVSTLTFTLTAAANVTVKLRDDAGTEVLTIAPKRWRRAAEHAIRFDPQALPDGVYHVEVTAVATGGRQATASKRIAVTRTLGAFAASRAVFSPNADGRADAIAFRFVLSAPAEVRLRVFRDGKWVATPLSGALDKGARTVQWDGRKRVGKLLDGRYDAVIEATDTVATTQLAVPFTSDSTKPRVRIVQRHPLRIRVSEPGELKLRFGGRQVVRRVEAAGELSIPNMPRRGVVRAVLWDGAGNRSIQVSKR